MQSIPCAICGEVHWPICKRESVTNSNNETMREFVTRLRKSPAYAKAIEKSKPGRPRQHESNAARQRAYRQRKTAAKS